jgi:DNA-binding XRE family transcriptional regulator
MGTGFDDFYREIEKEAEAEGPAALADLRAKELKYALINSLLNRRHELHWTQADLAERSGVAQEEISRIERGRKSPNMDTYARLAAALDLNVVLRHPRPQVA